MTEQDMIIYKLKQENKFLEQENRRLNRNLKLIITALQNACRYAISDGELTDEVYDYCLDDGRYGDNFDGIDLRDVYEYLIDQAQQELEKEQKDD